MARAFCLFAILVCCVGFSLQQSADPAQKRPLKSVLAEIGKKAGIYVVAVKGLENELVVPVKIDLVSKDNAEEQLFALIKGLKTPSRLTRIYLPEGPNWTAEEILAYARAEAALLKKPVGEIKPGSIEIWGQSIAPERAQAAIDTLRLRAVYVVLSRQPTFSGKWQTTYGEMNLQQTGTKVSGSYTTNNGLIQGTVAGNELRFTWYEQSNGSSGSAVVTLSDDGASFSGPWWNDSDPSQQAGTWTGQRMGE